MSRTVAETFDIATRICACTGLRSPTSQSLRILGNSDQRYNPSSFKIDTLALGTISAFSLAVSQYHELVSTNPAGLVTTSPLAAALEFRSERLYTVDGKVQPAPKSIGGLYQTQDGYVRIHDGFEVHRQGTRSILGLSSDSGKEQVARACSYRRSEELEAAAFADHAIIYSLRSFAEWDETDQGKSIPSTPIQITSLGPGSQLPHAAQPQLSDKYLKGLRVLEFSRVIAAPVGGRALAAHGADVLWVTCPGLEDQPYLDRDFGRGKRSLRLDLDKPADLERIRDLIRDADVLIQGYRPGSLARKGLGPQEVLELNPNIIYATISAHPQVEGNPWCHNRGFDSMVQTCSGINVADSEAFNIGLEASQYVTGKPLPCQALDHASGFLLATGIIAALCKRHKHGGAHLVEVSLAATGKFLRSLGRLPGRGGFEATKDVESYHTLVDPLREDGKALFSEQDSHFGKMKYVNNASSIEGANIGWDRMASPLGSDEARWL